MLFEFVTSAFMASLLGVGYVKKHVGLNDAAKIQRIFANAGWVGKDNGLPKPIRIRRKRRIPGGTEYVYQLPLAFDRKKVEEKIHVLEDGLNVTSRSIDWKALRDVRTVKQLKTVINAKKPRKEVELAFDGMLKIRIYNEPMPAKIDWDPSLLKPGTWSVPIGHTRNGKVMYHDFDDLYSLIVAGTPGYGKSFFLKMLISVLVLNNPKNVSFTLIDLKEGAAFKRFEKLKQVKYVGYNPEDAKTALESVKEDMTAMYRNFIDEGFEDVKEAKIPHRHFVIIDEGADIAQDPACIELLTDIARRGRAAGFYPIYSTQYPTSRTIPIDVKRNIPTRLTFVLDSNNASLAVLDQGGAEDLPMIKGRAIYKHVKCTTVQTPYMSNAEIETRIKPNIVLKARETDANEITPRGKSSLVLKENGLS
ncbi:FtsK/SpoIIIE domain-containing protein [Fictibacillus sp. 26RED30]|uniref:FtsK/SpoIIIE domain-containing protein n=1 Tax=Fictibacillus sp. 26RED30 TaxID=2745877 RepID=UPI0018CCD1DC|nr:FtsK/SpoIIIE domain-containing protein [Fictibacillus sp. 26RED30]MBH0159862.1 cell division protein FtsK [Fictibacillus sp. 26RED30]